MRRTFSVLALWVAASLTLSAQAAPKLVVVMVVDQMRADYVDHFRRDWTSGLKRLVDGGAWFTEAAYPYMTTETCAGHATISTGAFPHVHGQIGNTWFDRERGSVIPCTDDQKATTISYGHDDTAHTGPGRLPVPGLADEMRKKGAHVVTLSLKARSAIMLAGHGGDAVTWVADSLDTWETSTAFSSTPESHVKAFISANPLDADYGKVWDRMLPVSQYLGPDAGLAEEAVQGWTTEFPHVLTGAGESSKPDQAYYDQWEHTPFADEYLARMAASLVESMKLGSHDRTDFLGVSFSSPDRVGHSFGPRSQEIQDMYARLDRTIGGLLAELDRRVGTGQYVVALTADHGVTPIPEQLKAEGRDAGRIDSRTLMNDVENRATTLLGEGKYVARIVEHAGADVYFAPGVYKKLTSQPDLLHQIVTVLEHEPGIQRVFTADQLKTGALAADPQLRAAALSYVPERSGDLVVAPKLGWTFSSTGAAHGTATPDDQRVPVILYGYGIKPGQYKRAASPADIAPTLGAMVGVALEKAEGRRLTEAIR
jgi:predicted AlkP superfamily pyrophosphatase or phosphodiesterase